jgi:hypothetical protein
MPPAPTPTPTPTPPRRARRVLPAAAALVALVLVLAACGDDSGSAPNAASAQRPASGRGFFAQTPAVRACLKKQGVTLPDRPAGGRFRGGAGAPGAGGAPPNGTNATPPAGAGDAPRTSTDGRPPAGAGGRPGFAGRDPAQFAKLQAALKKCGVTPPVRGQGGRRQAPTTTTPTTAS